MLEEDAWRIESMKQTNMYGYRSISSSDFLSFYCQASSVASYHGSVMSIVMIRCRNHTTKNSGWKPSQKKTAKSWKDNIKE